VEAASLKLGDGPFSQKSILELHQSLLAKASLETNDGDQGKKKESSAGLDKMKIKLKSLQENIDQEAEMARKLKLSNKDSPEVEKIVSIVKKVVAIIPEVT